MALRADKARRAKDGVLAENHRRDLQVARAIWDSGAVPVTSAAALAIFAGSLALLLVRPRRVPDWSAALGGGVLLVLVGVLPLSDALEQLAASWNVFLFFLGLGLSAATADRAGVFRAAAEAAARLGRGSQPRLLISLYGAGVLVTAVLSNDATALLLTPVAFVVATRLGLDPRPYAFACALVANAASFLLPVSNPANLIVLSRAPLSLGAFLAHLLLPSFFAIALTLAGLLVVFRADLAMPYAVPAGIALVLRMVPATVLDDCRERAIYQAARPISRIGALFMVAVWLGVAVWGFLFVRSLFDS